MNKSIITQGTIIYPIKSDKYSNIRCYGIIISARCDIAQGKIEKVYLLTSVNAKEWITTDVGIHTVYKGEKNNIIGNLEKALSPHKLSFDVMRTMSVDDIHELIGKAIADTNERKKIIELIDEYCVIRDGLTEDRRKYARAKPKSFIDFLKKISTGTINHFFYLPQSQFLKNERQDDGLIVDLQEIVQIPFRDLKTIYSPGIDALTMNKLNDNEKRRLKRIYFIEQESDFVEVEGTIGSPWCELLMQRFSNDFIRIGVDGANENDYSTLALSI